MIAICACPHCGAEIEYDPSDVQVTCTGCGQAAIPPKGNTYRMPPIIPTVMPPGSAASPYPVLPNGEEILFQGVDVMVTSARFVVPGEAFAIRNITSVRMRPGPVPGNGTRSFCYIIFGILCILLMSMFAETPNRNWRGMGVTVLFMGLFLYGGWKAEAPPRKYFLDFTSTAGEKRFFSSTDRELIEGTASAIQEAMGTSRPG